MIPSHSMDLPFCKVRPAHLTCRLTGRPSFKNFEEIFARIPDSGMERLLFEKVIEFLGLEESDKFHIR